MRILFDKGVPVGLRRSLPHYTITTVHDRGWDDLKNGELLKITQDDFDVLITTDSNIKYQQRLAEYDIALIVLRAFNTKLESYLPLIPEIETILTTIQPSEVVYIYADQKLALKDQRKGKKKRKSDDNG